MRGIRLFRNKSLSKIPFLIVVLPLPLLFLVLFWTMEEGKASQEFKLQELIDQTQEGGVLEVPAGRYQAPIVISKPLKLQSTGEVEIYGQDLEALVHIRADNVELSNLAILDQSSRVPSIGILVEGDHNKLENIVLKPTGMGIKLKNAHHNLLTNLKIEGQGLVGASSSARSHGHGIDLWDAHDNRIEHVSIAGVQDGIYVESSKGTQLVHNQISYSRYGIHLMFTYDSILADNESFRNLAGMMVMGAQKTLIKGNTLKQNKGHPHSLGLLLYDVQEAEVYNNELLDNTVGLYIDTSKHNEIRENQVIANFVGVQMIKSKENSVEHNNFIANVIQGQGRESTGNIVQENYWDGHLGLDLDGDGRSELAYQADPFFLTITNEIPAYQLFFNAPGLIFLEELLQSETDQLLVDSTPRLQPLAIKQEAGVDKGAAVLVHALVLLSCTCLFYWGGIRK